MADGFLSQDEIDALLKGDAPAATDDNASESASQSAALSDMENDALGEVGNISMGSAATTLSILLSRRVSITTPKVSTTTVAQIREEYPLPYLVIEVGYTQGLHGTNLLAMKQQDALIIADLMMGGDGTNPPTELNELYMSAVTEAMNQMMGSTSTSMSTIFKKKIDIAPPVVNLYDFATENPIIGVATDNEPIVRVSFRMEVEDLIDSVIMQILSFVVAKELVVILIKSVNELVPPAPVAPAAVAAAPMAAAAPPRAPMAAAPQPVYAPAPTSHAAVQNVPVQPVQFAPLQPGTQGVAEGGNFGLIMDVPMQVTVELGRTKKLIRDILELGPGSVIELDKLAGEPVDIFVNTKLIARGEVVVIDENFGVRVTEIVSPVDRLKTLQ